MELTPQNRRRLNQLARGYRSRLARNTWSALFGLERLGVLTEDDLAEAAKHVGTHPVLMFADRLGLPVDYNRYDYGD